MYLYNLTLQRATSITHAVHGDFSGQKTQEIVISRGKSIDLLRLDPNTGKLHTLLAVEVFGIVRSLMSLTPSGGTKDYVVVGSDSQTIIILEYNPQKNIFETIHQEILDKSGHKSLICGQYLATDPQGRAVMTGALEKQKLVYRLNKGERDRPAIFSPLEVHNSNSLVYHMVGVDVGHHQPIFACLEIDYKGVESTGETIQKMQQTLNSYELAENQVIRKYSEPLEEHANFLVTVPRVDESPPAVLICSENYLTYKILGNRQDIRCPIPRRRNDLDDLERDIIFVCSATHKTNSMFFFLAQTEQGDIFKITLEIDSRKVTEIKLKYFDTVPVASSISILQTGFLFVASEFGNHYLYQIAHLDDDELEFSSAMQLEEGDTFFFAPRPLRNLVLADQIESLSPILSLRVADLAGEGVPQLYMLCGRGPRSSLKVLRHGLEMSEVASSELPGNPIAVWTVKLRSGDEYDAIIVVSYANGTIVLSVGETVEEVHDSRFQDITLILSCSTVENDALVLVYSEGIRQICADKRVNEWNAGENVIMNCAVNQRQVVIALANGELVYFEMDCEGTLNEYTERKRLDSDVLCMALASVASGEERSWFLVVGLSNSTICIVSLNPADCLTPRITEPLPNCAESLCVTGMIGGSSNNWLYIGLQTGTLLRTVIDLATGFLTDTKMTYLGSRPVKLFKIDMQNSEAVVAISSRSWIIYCHQSRFFLSPLSCGSLEYVSGINLEQCPKGIVAISNNKLRILEFKKLGSVFNQISYPLEYTPRKFIVHPDSNNLIILETEHNAYSKDTKKHMLLQMAEEMRDTGGEEEQEISKEMAEAFLKEDLPENVFSAPKAGNGMWASQMKIMNSVNGNLYKLVKFEQNEAALSLALVKFHSQPEHQWFLVIAVAKRLQMNPRSCTQGFLDTYKVDMMCRKVELFHRTTVDGVPIALCPYNGHLLAGVGRILILYDLGKKKLLRKCENKHIPNAIVNIEANDKRIFVSDIQESVFVVRYMKAENQLVVFADDTHPRWITTTCVLDYDSIAAADKFGNIVILRVPFNVTDDVAEGPAENKALWDRALLNGTSQKADTIAAFHIGEVVTCLQKNTLIPDGSESLIYATLSGTVGVLAPFTSHDDYHFFQLLEMYMRSENRPLCGGDHLSFRSYYLPVKNVIDGDLCEQYNSLDPAKQDSIASDLNKTSAEVFKMLEDIKTRYAFQAAF